jgi:hypothetical protein
MEDDSKKAGFAAVAGSAVQFLLQKSILAQRVLEGRLKWIANRQPANVS